MKKIKVGIIGAGYIAGVHAAVLAQDEHVEITAVHDVISECAERLARAHNAAPVGTPIELLERCDAVYITTPNTKHVSLSIAAIETGKQIFFEKPLATNIADALRTIGYDGVASVEIFRPEYWARDPFELARDARAAAERAIGNKP